MTDIYYQKYLKYKNKYLNLKNKIEQDGGMIAVGMPNMMTPGLSNMMAPGLSNMMTPGLSNMMASGMPMGMPLPRGMSRMTFPPYGLIYTTLKSKDDKEDTTKKKVMAYVPGWGWILTTTNKEEEEDSKDEKEEDSKDEKEEDGKYKTRYFFIPGRGMVAYNRKYRGVFPMVLNHRPISVLPNHLND